MKAKSLMYEITYEVRTAMGNGAWHTARVFGIKKIDILTLCGLYGYRVINVRRVKCYI